MKISRKIKVYFDLNFPYQAAIQNLLNYSIENAWLLAGSLFFPQQEFAQEINTLLVSESANRNNFFLVEMNTTCSKMSQDSEVYQTEKYMKTTQKTSFSFEHDLRLTHLHFFQILVNDTDTRQHRDLRLMRTTCLLCAAVLFNHEFVLSLQYMLCQKHPPHFSQCQVLIIFFQDFQYAFFCIPSFIQN